MRYLVDTNIVIWWLTNPDALATEIDQLLEYSAEHIMMSVVSPWEISIKRAKGKLSMDALAIESLSQLEFTTLPISLGHIITLSRLPTLHGDPFDRMLVAQAKSEKLTLITSDARLAEYPITVKLVGLSR